ncbi:MAG: LLM class flavin-dependent oxidoreductase [Gammaproteobacteria bacterium]|nr:LLM class flavin-dependent oxidoreductase [Gammaproteobacteria bacterium]
MKFGVLQFFSWPRRNIPLQTVYARALQRIEIMDKTGYDAVWLAEHHFTDYSVCPSVHLMGMHVAAKTRSLRIGTAVSLAALYHPLRLAEEVAMLDVLSDGRVNWGAGRGFDPQEFKTFGVPLPQSKERFREAVDIVLAAWTRERLDWRSEQWCFEDVEVLPKPLQQPHPPMWVAAGSPDAVQWAGEQGYSVMLGPHGDFQQVATHRNNFLATLQANGHSSANREIPMARLIAVAATDREAEQVARRGAGWIVATYKNESKGTANPVKTVEVDGRRQSLDPIDRYLQDVAIWGSPERVLDTLYRLEEEMHLGYLMCAPLSHESFLMFTEQVMPRFQSRRRAGAEAALNA